MELEELVPHVFHVEMPTKRALCKTFLRFQEFYESPEFKGRTFRLHEFKEWYKKSRDKDTFTYYNDWAGFNFPSYVLEPFFEGAFNPLANRERAVLEALEQHKSSKFYVIATYPERQDAIPHEVRHGLYHTNEQYQLQAKTLVQQLPLENRLSLEKFLTVLGYHKDVFEDEMHAYTQEKENYLLNKGIYIDGMQKVQEQLRILFRNTIKGTLFEQKYSDLC